MRIRESRCSRTGSSNPSPSSGELAANLTADYLIVLGETPRLAEQPRIALSPLIGEGSAAALPSNLDELVAIGVTKISEISAIWTHAGRILDYVPPFATPALCHASACLASLITEERAYRVPLPAPCSLPTVVTPASS